MRWLALAGLGWAELGSVSMALAFGIAGFQSAVWPLESCTTSMHHCQCVEIVQCDESNCIDVRTENATAAVCQC